MPIAITGDTIRTVGSATTVLVAVTGLVWYIANVESRIRTLEDRVHTLAVAPAIANSAGDKPASNAQANPVAQVCADLARKAVDESSLSGSIGAKLEAEQMLKSLGCLKE
jgi:hypothetical protein